MTASAVSLIAMMILIVWGLASVLWTAPSPTARGTPADAFKLPDGYQSKITNSLIPTMSIFEKSTHPPGVDTGEPIEQTTMFNLRYRTFKLRQLITLTPVTYKCAYNPSGINDLLSVVGRDATITQSFYDGSTIAYFGGFNKIEFDELEEGKQPMCTVTVVPTNVDPATGLEAGPVVTNVTGS